MKCVFVIGMHRTGTSAVAGLLQIFGVELGDNLMKADNYNTKGHFENMEFYRLHDIFLHSIGSSWKDLRVINYKNINYNSKILLQLEKYFVNSLSENFIFGLKDPRLALMLPIYLTWINTYKIKPYFICTKRDHLAIAKSLNKRDQLPIEYTLKLAKKYDSTIETYMSELSNKIIINYEDLIENVDYTVNKILEFIPFLELDSIKQERINSFIDIKMKHF